MINLLKRFISKYKFHVIFGSLLKVLESFFELLVPLVIKYMIDDVINNPLLSSADKTSNLWKCGGLLFLFAILGFASTILAQYLASRAGQGLGTDLRNDLYRHINSLSFKELDQINSSSLINRLQSDTDNVAYSFAMIIRLVLRAPIIVIGSTIMSFLVNYKAGIVFLFTTFLIFALMFFTIFKIVPLSKKSQEKIDDLTRISKENLLGNRVVRAFNRQKYEYEKFVDNHTKLTKIQSALSVVEALNNPLIFFIINLASIVIIYISGIQFLNKDITQGDVQALINYFTQIQLAVVAVANLVLLVTKGKTSSIRINEVYELKSSIEYGNIENASLKNEIVKFENVKFSYNNSSLVLDDINLKIYKGEHIGIIGGTGSGKSTLIYLLNRFYDVSDGNLYFCGENVKRYAKKAIIDNISIVMQKTALFNGTIKENILKGKYNATDEEVIRALKIAQAYDFVAKYEDGINTLISENARNISGGQKQRLSIARAIVKNSELLILDDSSSALDYQTESKLNEEIRKLNKTVISISQRANSIKSCDRIIVLDKGKIVGTGTHEELLNSCSIYQEICNSQDLGNYHV